MGTVDFLCVFNGNCNGNCTGTVCALLTSAKQGATASQENWTAAFFFGPPADVGGNAPGEAIYYAADLPMLTAPSLFFCFLWHFWVPGISKKTPISKLHLKSLRQPRPENCVCSWASMFQVRATASGKIRGRCIRVRAAPTELLRRNCNCYLDSLSPSGRSSDHEFGGLISSG